MKKLLALVLALVMLCSVASASDTFVYNYDPSTAPYDGVWVDIGCGFMAYLPNDWLIMEVPAELAGAGMKNLFQSPDYTCALGVSDTVAMGSNGRLITDYDTLYNEYWASGIPVYHVTINGMQALGYDMDDVSESGLLILDGLGVVYTIGFAPITQEELGMNILFSVQPLPAN